MKVTVDVDCTPEEARRFLGLPDLTPVHDLYLDKMKETMENGITPDTVEKLMSSWGPMSEAGLSMWTRFFDQIGGTKK
ncbi:hypothetical protein HFP51_11280 [Parasphingopyxis sp. CP4]|uniref:DUF6489 family protein n=1 Tax=Parasphingopyxis sp. CP4 TaxID=2724527 RepID=UPI0015A11284|nr:DUF6489 family protein [Parasphingopyxis sp. CP4]QLC22708.1 hypothetical protein HFP51_11280 [Parasphingopyxis sp. CP4]